MIYACLNFSQNQVHAIFYDESTGKKMGEGNYTSRAEIERLMYFYNRNMLVDKLSKWLLQRSVALKKVNRNYVADQLFSDVVRLRSASPGAIKKYVQQRASQFRLCAPSEKSPMHNYYAKEIAPLLDFCANEISANVHNNQQSA